MGGRFTPAPPAAAKDSLSGAQVSEGPRVVPEGLGGGLDGGAVTPCRTGEQLVLPRQVSLPLREVVRDPLPWGGSPRSSRWGFSTSGLEGLLWEPDLWAWPSVHAALALL